MAAGLAAALGVGIGRWYFSEKKKPADQKTLTIKVGDARAALVYTAHRYSETGFTMKKGEAWPPVAPALIVLAPIAIGSLKLALGQFYIRTIAEDAKWTLVLTGLGNPEEVGRTPMYGKALDSTVEELEWVFESGVLKMRWGKTEASLNVAAG